MDVVAAQAGARKVLCCEPMIRHVLAEAVQCAQQVHWVVLRVRRVTGLVLD